jgi:hypothetical protein
MLCSRGDARRRGEGLDAGDVLDDAFPVSSPRNHAEGEMRSRLHRHRSLPQSSSASRFTAGASGFFILSQSGDRPDR